MAAIAQKLSGSGGNNERESLELFTRKLCEHIRISPYPSLTIEPHILNIGKVSIGRQKYFSIQLKNLNRGFAWGRIESQGLLPGLYFPKSFNCLQDTSIKIYLHTLDEVQPGFYNGKLILYIEGIENTYEIQIYYEIEPTKVSIKPDYIKLGLLQPGKSTTTKIKVDWEVGVRLKGKIDVSDSLSQIKITPFGEFDYSDNSMFEIMLTIDTNSLEPNWHEGYINLQANGNRYEIFLSFNTPIRRDIIFQFSIIGSLISGLIAFSIRYLFSTATKSNVYLLHIPSSFFDLSSTNSQFFTTLGLLIIGILLCNQKLYELISSVTLSLSSFLTKSLFPKIYLLLKFLFKKALDAIPSVLVPIFANVIYYTLLPITLLFCLGLLGSFFNAPDPFSLIMFLSFSVLCFLLYKLLQSEYSMASVSFLAWFFVVSFIVLVSIQFIFWGFSLIWSTCTIIITGLKYSLSCMALGIFIVFDLTVYPLSYIRNDPTVGWFVIGSLLGGGVGLIKALKKIKQRSWLSKIYVILYGIPLTLMIVGHFLMRISGS